MKIPLESLIPQEVDNLLIGGKSIAVSHIVNALTRVHMSEWGIGAAAGVTAVKSIAHMVAPVAGKDSCLGSSR